jgi:hypothetical protein
MPWDSRSLLFRDPDGNLVDFFTPVTDRARERSARAGRDESAGGSDRGANVPSAPVRPTERRLDGGKRP